MIRAILIAFAVLSILSYWVSSVGDSVVGEKTFEVSRGMTIDEIPEKLDLDISSLRFKLYRKWKLSDYELSAGQYQSQEDTTVASLFANTLKNPVSRDISIRILPGWNIYDIDVLLAKQGFATTGEFIRYAQDTDRIADLSESYPFVKGLTTLEGYILPDTYRVRQEWGITQIMKKILGTFESQVIENITKDIDLQELRDIVTLASIVEREERNTANKSIVAGILAKRIEIGMPIGADATTCYPFKKLTSECTPSFINQHIYDDTPYNTRKYGGLPPTPISNPSRDTIRATLNSTSSDYLFYLHCANGEIRYGKTLDEHVANKVCL